ncbi:hypothetical protein ACFORL_00960 [Legionella dresdenensis]|uniref:Uncharacterized protein n=1 Tax=Legionella dresdenensis TaxID=450200 RepID=A0ABV8CBJ0_9GAMM
MPHPITSSLTINKGNQFFIAICKYVNLRHSFVVAGVQAKGEHILLCAFGKYFDIEKIAENTPEHLRQQGKLDIGFFDILAFVFNQKSLESNLINEPFLYIENDAQNAEQPQNISYKALDISYQEYLQFLYKLKEITRHAPDMQLEALIPDKSIEKGDEVTLRWRPLSALQSTTRMNTTNLNINSYYKLKMCNTCRHSAISLVTEARGTGPGVSPYYFKELPLETTIYAGKMGSSDKPLLILPTLPPSDSELSTNKRSILERLYQRLERIILIENQHPLTYRKFMQFYKLYQHLSATKASTLDSFYRTLQQFYIQNKELLETHRKPGFFNSMKVTGSVLLFQEFEQEAKAVLSKQTI